MSLLDYVVESTFDRFTVFFPVVAVESHAPGVPVLPESVTLSE